MANNDVPELKNYKKSKKQLANTFNVSKKTVQRAIDEIVGFSLTNGNTISSAEFVAAAQDEDALLHDIFDWEATQQEREAVADAIFSMIEYVVAGNGKLYRIYPQE